MTVPSSRKESLSCARLLHVVVVGNEPGNEADRQAVGQHVLGPGVVAGAGRIAAVDADGDGGRPAAAVISAARRRELLGEGNVGRRIVLAAGAHAAGAGGAVVIGLPASVLLVADFPVLDRR